MSALPPEAQDRAIMGQTSLVRTQASIVVGELSRRLNRAEFCPPHDVDFLIRGLERFVANLADLKQMRGDNG